MSKVIIHDAIDEAGLDLLARRTDLDICTVARDDEESLRREIADADGLILRYLPLGTEALAASTRLKVIARHGVGCDNIDLAKATALKIPVATVGDANAVTVAELTLLFMLAAAKKSRHYDESVRARRFSRARSRRSSRTLRAHRPDYRLRAHWAASRGALPCLRDDGRMLRPLYSATGHRRCRLHAGRESRRGVAEGGLCQRARAAERRNAAFDRPDSARLDETGCDPRQRCQGAHRRRRGPS